MKKEKSHKQFQEDVGKIVDETMKNLTKMIDSNTVLGDPVVDATGTTIIPVSKVIVGFVSGGGELSSKQKNNVPTYPFAGGSGSGYTIIPLGFLTGKDNQYRFVSVDNGEYDRFMGLINSVLTVVLEGAKKHE